MRNYVIASMLALLCAATLAGCRSRNSVNNTTLPTTMPTTVATQPTTVATQPTTATTAPTTQPQTESATDEAGEETSTAPVGESEEENGRIRRSTHRR